MRSTRTRPTLAALVCLVFAGGLHELSRETGGGWLAVFAGLLLALPLASFALRPRLADVTVERVVHGQPTVGSSTATTLRLHNTGVRRLGRVVVEDELHGHRPARIVLAGLAAGAVVDVAVSREALARGVGPAGVLRLIAPGPLGCLQVRSEHPVLGLASVHPQVLDPPPALSRSLVAGAQSEQAGAGTDVLGLRDWRPGDAVMSLSSRATARHGRPVLLERERDEPPGLHLLVTAGAGPAWERAVSQAAGALLQCLRSGAEPVLLGLGRHDARSGPALLDLLAGADGADEFSVQTMDAARRRAGDGVLTLVVSGPHADLLRGRDPRLVVLGG